MSARSHPIRRFLERITVRGNRLCVVGVLLATVAVVALRGTRFDSSRSELPTRAARVAETAPGKDPG